MKEKLQQYLEGFPNLTAQEKELLLNKFLMTYMNGQIDGANELRQLYHKIKKEKICSLS